MRRLIACACGSIMERRQLDAATHEYELCFFGNASLPFRLRSAICVTIIHRNLPGMAGRQIPIGDHSRQS